ncbi:hypothetical protein P3S67_005279 [Capsicum chacoense]
MKSLIIKGFIADPMQLVFEYSTRYNQNSHWLQVSHSKGNHFQPHVQKVKPLHPFADNFQIQGVIADPFPFLSNSRLGKTTKEKNLFN